MDTIKVTLPNRMTVEGTAVQVTEVAKAMGYPLDLSRAYYDSASKGLIAIKDMETTHLRNAILKQYQSWVDEMHKIKNPQAIVARMMNGITDPGWLALVKEYLRRKEV